MQMGRGMGKVEYLEESACILHKLQAFHLGMAIPVTISKDSIRLHSELHCRLQQKVDDKHNRNKKSS